MTSLKTKKKDTFQYPFSIYRWRELAARANNYFSSFGVRQLKDFGAGVGFSTQAKQDQTDSHTKNVIQKALSKTFSPEFLNRIDDVVIFNSLEKSHIHQIIDIALKDVFGRLETLGYTVELTTEAKDFLADKGFDPQFGARPLHRAIQKFMEDPLAEAILSSEVKQGATLEASLNEAKDGLVFTPKKKSRKKTATPKEEK